MIEDNLHREYYNDRWKRQGTYLHPHAELRLSRINLFCEHWLQATGTQRHAGQPCAILDLGCGTGWLSKRLRRFGMVAGVEPSSEGIQRAISTYGSDDAGIEFLVGTGETLLEQGRQAAFDLVVSSEVIEYVVDQLAFLQQINGLLRQNGYAVLSTPRAEVKSAWIAAGAEQQPVENWLSKNQLLLLVEEAGFDVVRYEVGFIEFTRRGIYRVLLSPKFESVCRKIGIYNLLELLRKTHALYQFLLIRKR